MFIVFLIFTVIAVGAILGFLYPDSNIPTEQEQKRIDYSNNYMNDPVVRAIEQIKDKNLF